MMFGYTWLHAQDGDPRAYALFRRHYSTLAYKSRPRGAERRFCGPGEKMVLLTPDCNALFVWRKFVDKSGQQGINCAIFRNEGPQLSSELILAAERLAWQRWPEARLYTYVNPRKVRSSNPGYCFKKAGWRVAGQTKTRKLSILEKTREDRQQRR